MTLGFTIGQSRAIKGAVFGAALLLSSVSAFAAPPSPQAQALFDQAKAFHDGTGVSQDLVKARTLYEQAAARNHNFARINLGYMYFVGEGVAQDYEQSRSWYYRAAIDGDKDAQKMMVVFYQNGLGVIACPEKADFWKAKAESVSKPALTAPKSTINAETVKPAPKQVAPKKVIAVKPAQSQAVASVTSPGYPVQSAVVPASVNPVDAKPAVPTKQATKDDLSALMAAMGSAPAKAVAPKAAPSAVLQTRATAAPVTAVSAAPVSAAQVPSPTAVALPQGASLSLIAIMAVMAFTGGLWFLTQLSKLLVRRDKHRFAVAFYENHREDLRSTFLRIPEEQRLHRYIDDPWVVSVSVLMIRFAQTQKNASGRPYKMAKRVTDALRQSPLKARQEVFGVMPFIQNLIMLDINSSENEGGPRETMATLLARAVKSRSQQAQPQTLHMAEHALSAAE